MLAQFVLGRHPALWSQQWFLMASWVSFLPELSESESRRRWALAFDLIVLRFGGAESEEREMSQAAVAALRAFVVAGGDRAAGKLLAVRTRAEFPAKYFCSSGA
ncbi:hypothetical protein [Nocardia sp. NPDC004604]|uniref:hypothetical protein n=1 Tax=Nocardia sp. NPDC004604 TaxID=3157013 RepID=UPI0033A7DA84